MKLKLEKINKKNISLVGLMGSGKSLIGKLLSKDLGMKHYDSDNHIEKTLKKSINNIFIDHGEEYFRNIEKEVILALLKYKNCIISLGGGAIMDKLTRKALKASSYTIYLKTDIDLLCQRLKFSKKRPLIKKVNIKEKLISLLNTREKYYNSADLIINNHNDIDTVLKEIKENLNTLYE